MKQKQRAIDNSILADQIIRGIGLLFSQKEDNVEIKQIWDYYPDLFKEEKKKAEEQKEINELEEFKEKEKGSLITIINRLGLMTKDSRRIKSNNQR